MRHIYVFIGIPQGTADGCEVDVNIICLHARFRERLNN